MSDLPAVLVSQSLTLLQESVMIPTSRLRNMTASTNM